MVDNFRIRLNFYFRGAHIKIVTATFIYNIRLLHLEIYTNTFYRPGRILKSPLTMQITTTSSEAVRHEAASFDEVVGRVLPIAPAISFL